MDLQEFIRRIIAGDAKEGGELCLNSTGSTALSVGQLVLNNLYTPDEAADYLNLAPGTLAVWRSTNRKVLPYVKIGGRVRYRREDLDNFINANLHNA